MTGIPRATVDTVPTPDGEFTIISQPDGSILASGWTTDAYLLAQRIHPSLRPDHMEPGTTAAAAAVAEYYAGEVNAVTDVAVVQRGTQLQEQGWAALRTLPAGGPVSYSEFAVICGNPAATRAAASICARNAAALFVPCHRVLRSDGSLGGFAWGVSVKRSLLERELHGTA